MAQPVKPSRPYHSPLRAEQARQTRERVLDAAEQHFADHGYGATKINAIAATAGVAPDTVYSTFNNKRGILGALVEARVRGGQTPILEQAPLQTIRAQHDQRRQLELLAHDLASRHERFHTVYRIVTDAASNDTEIAALLKTMLAIRAKNLGKATAWIAANGPLRNELNLHDAADTLWTITSPEVHRLLRTERSWSQTKYRNWLADTLTRLLLP
jgi:AcrR family transcriptional regulator